jgi:hypothetical protein
MLVSTATPAPDGENPTKRILSAGKTPLSKSLNEVQAEWLLNHAVDRWGALHGALSNWRGKLKRFEKMAEDDYSDRKTTAPDPNITDASRSIFEKQNNTLGVVSGFCDFVFAQASDDLFGTRPWMQAKPEGANDPNLASLISAHSQWKFNQTNLEEALTDAVKVAINLGLVFVKPRWIKEIETFEESKFVAWRISTDSALLDEAGEFLTEKEAVDERITAGEFDGTDIQWQEMLIEQTDEVYNNVACDCLDYEDVAFDAMAPQLDLRYTPFFHRFRMGVLDAISFYELDEDQALSLQGAVAAGRNGNARSHRGEVEAQPVNWELDANPEVEIVEGFMRCDPFQKNNPKRLQVVFIPELRIMLSCNYLRGISPSGLLPVFPVRCFKVPRRIMGIGYWERCEDANNAVDIQYNSTTYNDRSARVPIKGFDPSKFKDKKTAKDFNQDPDKVFELMPGETLEMGLQFKTIPETNAQSVELLNQMHQLMQMRYGITSAAQGELKGVPGSNTATGVRDLTTRGAVLVKVPIAQITKDIRHPTEYSVHLNYANLDREEAFVWGEGQDAELLKITPGDVQGLRANVSLTMSQSQNVDALEDALGASKALMEYIQIPEPEKTAARRLYIQILRSYGFTDAEKILREAVTDPASLLAMVPPEMQGPLQAAMQAAGMIAPPSQPGTEQPGDSPMPPVSPAIPAA